LRPLGGYSSPVPAEVLAARTEIERLIDDLAEAGSEMVDLRAAVSAAERRAEAWRSKYEHATAWDGRERRGVSMSMAEPERRTGKPTSKSSTKWPARFVIAALAGYVAAIVVLACQPGNLAPVARGLAYGLATAAAMLAAATAAYWGGRWSGRRQYYREVESVNVERSQHPSAAL
jgi:Flp pilus assembly protein TadB